MELGKQIAYYRKQKGLTQDGLAKLLNISNQAVSKWEANQSYPDITLLTKLADIFEISLDQLFGRDWNSQEPVWGIDEPAWEDDGELRAVIYVGKKLVAKEKLTDKQKQICENVGIEYGGAALNITSEFCVFCNDVHGNVDARNCVECNNVEGSVNAGNDVDCNNVGGDVHAGGSVDCNDVGGMVTAGDSVDCNSINGMVTAGDCVNCGSVSGSIYAQKVIVEE